MNADYEHRDPQAAFNEAIKQGRLSTDQEADNYAGNYKYMGHYSNGSAKKAQFKNIDTRKYID